MDENAGTELQLSEEAMQHITGGCKECNHDKNVYMDHRMRYYMHIAHGQLAQASGQEDLYQFHADRVFFHGAKAVEAMERIEQRAETPGHVNVPKPPRTPGKRWVM